MAQNVLIPVVAMPIPLSAIVLGIGIAFWFIYWEHQKKRLQYQERQLMIEKGLTPPPVLPDQPKKKITPDDCLRRGTVLLFLGLGLAVGYGVLGRQTSDEELVGMIGLAAAIVGFLGLGYLAYYFIARPKASDAETPMSM
jgi:hypothetical protein